MNEELKEIHDLADHIVGTEADCPAEVAIKNAKVIQKIVKKLLEAQEKTIDKAKFEEEHELPLHVILGVEQALEMGRDFESVVSWIVLLTNIDRTKCEQYVRGLSE